jgi:hypothetical protein
VALILAALGMGTASIVRADQFWAGDNFNDNSIDLELWSPETIIGSAQSTASSSTHLLVESGQRLHFTYPGQFYFGFVDSALRWTGNYGSYTNDWVIHAEFTITDAVFFNEPFMSSLDYVGFNLEISDQGNHGNRVRMRFVSHLIALGVPPLVERWAQGMAWKDGAYQGNQEVAVAGTNLVARIAWKARDQTLLLQYDATGPADGYQWQTVRSLNVGSTGADWQMNSNSHFQFRLVVDTDHYLQNPVSVGAAYADNLVMVSAPVVLSQPESKTVLEGGDTALAVNVGPYPPLNFEWRRNGQLVPHGNAAVLSFDSVQIQDAGEYQVTVTNEAGSTTSVPVTLAVNPNPDLPLFQQHPQNISSYIGQSVQFSVQVQSATQVSYQWLHASTNLPGGTAATLSLTGLTAADAGEYRVRVTNSAGSKLSQVAQLTVASTPPPRLDFAQLGPTLIIHWPSSATGFTAWTSESMDGPWNPFSGGYFLYQGNRIAIQADPVQGTRFFRIQK